MGDNRPNVFVIGAAKAGTTSLYDLLRQHPQVYMASEKEPAFFSDDEYFARGDEWYLRTFFRDSASFPVRGEATPAYLFYGDKVAPRIADFSAPGGPKFVAVFRDPARLVYSYYWNSVREGRETLSFEEAMAAEPARMLRLQPGLAWRGRMSYAYSRIAAFATQLQAYLALFPREDFLFLVTADLSEPMAVVERMQAFLGLPDHAATIKPVRSNASALPRHRKLHQWLRGRSTWKELAKPFIPRTLRHRMKLFLLGRNLTSFTPPALDDQTANEIRQHYRAETERLQKIIDRDLSDWLPA